MSTIDTCPRCGLRLDWHGVAVEREGFVRAYADDFMYADCRCGLALELRAPLDETETADAIPAASVQPTLFDGGAP